MFRCLMCGAVFDDPNFTQGEFAPPGYGSLSCPECGSDEIEEIAGRRRCAACGAEPFLQPDGAGWTEICPECGGREFKDENDEETEE